MSSTTAATERAAHIYKGRAESWFGLVGEHMVSCPAKSACSVEAMITFNPALPRNASFFVAAEVLAKHSNDFGEVHFNTSATSVLLAAIR